MNGDSQLFGVSLRGWIAILLTLTVCTLSSLARDIKEPLYSAFLLVLGFYFGQKTQKENGTNGGNGNV